MSLVSEPSASAQLLKDAAGQWTEHLLCAPIPPLPGAGNAGCLTTSMVWNPVAECGILPSPQQGQAGRDSPGFPHSSKGMGRRDDAARG